MNNKKNQMSELLKETLQAIESQRYLYTTKNGVKVLFQRLNKDAKWYVVSSNEIVNWGTYRSDLEEWCDMAL